MACCCPTSGANELIVQYLRQQKSYKDPYILDPSTVAMPPTANQHYDDAPNEPNNNPSYRLSSLYLL